MENIGRYRILKELGRGAGGVVYLAEDPKIGRKVAIKTISVAAGGAVGETLRKRLQREARSAGSLAHPNIVTVFELDDEGPFTFVVMEFVEGVTLRDVMTEGERIPNEQILALLRQVADGLDFAHARAVVHRDIKPANIMVTADHSVKIADFGVAKMLGDATMGLTQAGMAIGTPHYMSPEQVLGKPVTGQSDQFSLAVIAYELLARSRPFEGDSITSIMYQIVNEDPEPQGMESAGLKPVVFTVLMRGLAKEPGDRYPTCSGMVGDLENAVLYNRAPSAVVAAPVISAAQPVPAAIPPPARETPAIAPPAPIMPAPVELGAPVELKQPRRKWAIAAAILVLLLAVGFWLALRKKTGSEPSQPAPEAETPAPTQSAPIQTTPASIPTKTAPAKAETPAAARPRETATEKPTKPGDNADGTGEAKLGVHGTFAWSGTLAAGDSVEIADGQPASGSLSGHMPPRRAAIKVVEVDPPDVSVDQTPSAGNGYTLRLVNSGRDVSNFSVSWRLAKKGESADE